VSFFSALFGGASGDSLSPADFVAQRDPAAPVLDVRTPAEFADGHLAGAVNVDVMAPDFQSRVAAMNLPPDGPVYLYCRSGNRSGTAAGILRQMGHAGAVNVGGFDALRRAGAESA
jgi:rhodanese-related sulfurtransferase